MGKIRFYRIDVNYIKYLWGFDDKVQYNPMKLDVYTEKRPYIGIVLKIDDIDCFAPLEHPRPSHATMKNNPFILKIEKGRYGLIAFNNMIPVSNSQLITFDFKDEDERYRELLKSQFIFCDNNKSEIFDRAKRTYDTVASGNNSFYNKVCCNFKLLEEKMKLYNV